MEPEKIVPQTPNPGDEVAVLKETLAKLEHEKNELHGRATRAESSLKELKEKPPEKVDDSRLDEVEQRVELRMRAYSPEEIAEIAAYATAKKMKLVDAADTPFVKAAIKSLREEKKSSDLTPSPSGRTVTADGKQWSDLKTDDERRQAFSKLRESYGK